MLNGIVRYASLEIHGGDRDPFGYEFTSFPPGKNPDTHGFLKKKAGAFTGKNICVDHLKV